MLSSTHSADTATVKPCLTLAEAVNGYHSGYFHEFVHDWGLYYQPLGEQLETFRTRAIPSYTMFFREETNLPTIEGLLVPLFRKGKQARITIIGCSIGCDAYSLLMKLWPHRDSLTIDACDVNPECIDIARRGSYDLSLHCDYSRIIENTDETVRRACISESESDKRNHVRITFTDDARNRIRFYEWDIFQLPLPAKQNMILLQNVLMHYQPSGRERILRNINNSLQTNGLLVCEAYGYAGHVEEKNEYGRWMMNLEHVGLPRLLNLPGRHYMHGKRIYRKGRRRRNTGA